MQGQDIILVRGVHKTYHAGKIKVHALKGVDLHIRRGEMVAIMGPSGCGKTTLLNCLSGIDEIDRGAISVMGQSLPQMSDKRPAELSSGQQQRVAIARALVNNPAIVWADEPTGNLDSETTAELMDVLCRLNKENGQTFVMVTHSPDVGERANRIIHMRDGIIESDKGNDNGG